MSPLVNESRDHYKSTTYKDAAIKKKTLAVYYYKGFSLIRDTDLKDILKKLQPRSFY